MCQFSVQKAKGQGHQMSKKTSENDAHLMQLQLSLSISLFTLNCNEFLYNMCEIGFPRTADRARADLPLQLPVARARCY